MSISKFNVAADGTATAVTTAPTFVTNATTGLIDALAGSQTVAYGGNALRTIAGSAMVVGAAVGNWAAHRAWKSASERGTEPKRYLGMFTV